jgi:hypothetical protein
MTDHYHAHESLSEYRPLYLVAYIHAVHIGHSTFALLRHFSPYFLTSSLLSFGNLKCATALSPLLAS